jgi:hypothetical protein
MHINKQPLRPHKRPQEPRLTLLETLGKPAARVVAERCRFIQEQSSVLDSIESGWTGSGTWNRIGNTWEISGRFTAAVSAFLSIFEDG